MAGVASLRCDLYVLLDRHRGAVVGVAAGSWHTGHCIRVLWRRVEDETELIWHPATDDEIVEARMNAAGLPAVDGRTSELLPRRLRRSLREKMVADGVVAGP